jgi:ATP-dependent HslUV protease ATP-binding subunit HslU
MRDLNALTPNKIVEALDKYIIGQDKAKRTVAIALRNRWRRMKVKGELQEEIVPNNIILIGPTGVGKTEIARRIAHLTNAPFIKVEASKFTEVGYVGRDVESMVRELMDLSVSKVRVEVTNRVHKKAAIAARERVLDILTPPPSKKLSRMVGQEQEEVAERERYERSRERFTKLLAEGKLKDREILVPIENALPSQIEIMSNTGGEQFDLNLGDLLGNLFNPRQSDRPKKKMKIPEAIRYLTAVEQNKMVKTEEVVFEAKKRIENNGIIFIDEIDKIASSDKKAGIDISRSGVQRDLLPIVEGSNVHTKYGMINTRHILFIAAGAFHVAKPSDLIPELQGRFPLREELNSLTKDDFIKILLYPDNSLIKQYKALFKVEKTTLLFDNDAIEEVAHFATKANEKMEDIGARRLHTIMTTLLDEYMFNLPEKKYKTITISKETVREKLDKIIEDEDLARYIL